MEAYYPMLGQSTSTFIASAIWELQEVRCGPNTMQLAPRSSDAVSDRMCFLGIIRKMGRGQRSAVRKALSKTISIDGQNIDVHEHIQNLARQYLQQDSNQTASMLTTKI